MTDKIELKANKLEAIRIEAGQHFAGAWRFQRPDGRCYVILPGDMSDEQVNAILKALYLAKCDGFGEAQAHMREALGL